MIYVSRQVESYQVFAKITPEGFRHLIEVQPNSTAIGTQLGKLPADASEEEFRPQNCTYTPNRSLPFGFHCLHERYGAMMDSSDSFCGRGDWLGASWSN